MPQSSFPEKLSGALTIARKRVTQTVQLLNRIPLEECYEGSPDGRNLPRVPGLYAFKHQDGRILYIGRSNNIRNRFRDGHSVFVELFFAGYVSTDVRIAIVPLSGDYLPYLEVIEAMVIFTLTPEFNKKQYSLTEIATMVAVRSFTIPNDVQLTDLLPPTAQGAIADYANANQLQPNQVIELALAQFFDYDAVTLEGYEHLQSFAQLKNQIAKLQAELEGLKREKSKD
ncbi:MULTISPECIES: hypothetical protein [Trichocoleus]|uniref:GIY-YIG domain-containing protein n=1 Tax=Trichocoleus desertorum GB2-A4 TaxID=2933944 RepID=A0ABV0JI46_9CYAN|nr:hypothetical protein [Trichocoleus sp. FACHB-46]MBD1864794.1 hypothetical protein [Trichocoleus sp. FACHB-46]